MAENNSLLDDIQVIKENINIVDYIQYMGYEIERHGNKKYHLKNNNSVVINPETQYYHEYADGSFGDVVDFVINFSNRNFSKREAVTQLLDYIGVDKAKEYKKNMVNRPKVKTTVKNEKETLIEQLTKNLKRNLEPIELPEKNDNYRRVYAYLCKSRGIDKKVVDYFVKNKMLYEDKKRHNCNFVCFSEKDPNKKPIYLMQKGTNTYKPFQFENTNNDYEKGFYINNKSKSLIITESPIDCMSYMELFDIKPNEHNFLMLCGTEKIVSLIYRLKENPDIDKITIAVDNDEAGEKCINNIKQLLKELNYKGNIDVQVPKYNDFNDDIKEKKGLLDKDTVKDKLVEDVKDIIENFKQNPSKIIEYLKFSSQFYGYSPRNTMLIENQNPGACFVGSYKFFKDKGYAVKKGQKAMKILVPVQKQFYIDEKSGKLLPLLKASDEIKESVKKGEIQTKKKLYFNYGNVFDIAQTSCPLEDYPRYINFGYSSDKHKDLYEGMKEFCKSIGFDTKTEDLSSVMLRGTCSPNGKKILINEKLNDSEKASTLIHETGHAILHLDMEKVREKSIEQVEIEADCFSVMLLSKLNLPIEENRKKHLVDNFNKLKEDNKDDYDKMFKSILNNVFSIYNTHIKEIEKKCAKYMNPENKKKLENNKNKELNVKLA